MIQAGEKLLLKNDQIRHTKLKNVKERYLSQTKRYL
jgi:hypothetical protein